MNNIKNKNMQSDFFYYKKWNFENLFEPEQYSGFSGYVILKPWPAGFNNVRMSLELAVCVAYISNKVLVLPPTIRMYHVPGQDHALIEDFFDVEDMGIKTISFAEFCKLNNIPESYDSVETMSVVDITQEHYVLNFTDELPSNSFLKKRPVSDMFELFKTHKNVFFNGTLFGNFYLKIHTKLTTEIRKLVARHVHYSPYLFHLAQNAVEFLGDKNYYAIHIRRTDFERVRKEIIRTAEEILDNIKDIIPTGSKLYIATDHKDMEFFIPFKEKYEVFFYHDVAHVFTTTLHENYIGLVEQLICTRAIKFVGNELSTFSSYIYRLRGYMDDIEDKNYYVNTYKFKETDQLSFIENSHHTGNWTREFKDGWEF